MMDSTITEKLQKGSPAPPNSNSTKSDKILNERSRPSNNQQSSDAYQSLQNSNDIQRRSSAAMLRLPKNAVDQQQISQNQTQQLESDYHDRTQLACAGVKKLKRTDSAHVIENQNAVKAIFLTGGPNQEAILLKQVDDSSRLATTVVKNNPRNRPKFTEMSSSSSHQSNSSEDDDDDDIRMNKEEDAIDSEDDYFESSSQSSADNISLTDRNNNDHSQMQNSKLYSLDENLSGQTKLRQLLFSQRTTPGGTNLMNDKLLFQLNSEELHRQELGGIVVYDAFARIIGNSHLTEYYEKNPPQKVDFNRLFTKQEVGRADKLFYKEPRERDFQNDFDKFLFKHLPKFAPQRDYTPSSQQGVGGQPSFHSYTINVPQQENILIFDSRFECGNLRRAIKVNNVEYNLWLENDVNTKGHTQWFYFKVLHKYPKKQKIQFNILNLAKPQSLYSMGMKPCIFSKKHHRQSGREWFRGGENVKYFQNEIPRKNTTNGGGNQANMILINNNGAGEGLEYYFTLTFIYEFDEDEDEVYFAQAVPYTYTDLNRDLIAMQEKADGKNIVQFNILCKELSGSPVPMVTITEGVDTFLDYYDQIQLNKELPNVVRKQFHKKYMKCKKLYKQSLESKGKVRKLLMAAFEEELNSFCENHADLFKSIDDTHNSTGDAAIFGRRYDQFNVRLRAFIVEHFHKKAVIITSRVHPGEPQSSFMVKGMLDYLVSDEAAELRKHFVFRVIPMLNIDGVIYGNQRCSLLGVDLNRRWVSPNVHLHPTIYYSKQLIRQMHNERRVLAYCDLHGHSRKQNAFFYACTYKNYEHEGRIKNAQLRMMPLLCCHKSPSFYKFSDCRFRIEKCKESTARVVIFREFNIMNAFTLEASFFGKEPQEVIPPNEEGETTERQRSYQQLILRPNQPQGTHFTTQDLQIIGQTFPQVLMNYLPKEQSKLEILSGKILEIFYEEFVKLIPPYVLRREEDKKRQLMGFDQQENNNNAPNMQQLQNQYPNATYGKSPTMAANNNKYNMQSSSPRVSVNGLNPSQLAFQRVSTLRKAQKTTNAQAIEQTPLMNNRKIVRIQNVQTNQSSTPNQNQPALMQSSEKVTLVKKQTTNFDKSQTTGKKTKKSAQMLKKEHLVIGSTSNNPIMNMGNQDKQGTGTETDTFSQMINFHQNQEELLDLEAFIKGENHKLKIQRENGINGDQEDDEIDGEGGEGSDSSADSDESSKNLLVQQTLQQQKNLTNKSLVNKKAPIKKSLPPPQVKKKDEDDVFRSLDNTTKKKKQQLRGSSANNTNDQGTFKFKPVGKNLMNAQHESRQNMRFVTKTQSKNSRDSIGEITFDKIPHKQQNSRSPKSKTIDLEQEDLEADEELEESPKDRRSQLSDDLNNRQRNISALIEEEKTQHAYQAQQITTTNMFFKSYEDLKGGGNITTNHHQRPFEKHNPQQHILPLYENPAYHQNRLSSITSSQDRHYFYGGQSAAHSSIVPTTNANILYSNVRALGNPFNFRNAHQRQFYDPYHDDHNQLHHGQKQKLNKSTLQQSSGLQNPPMPQSQINFVKQSNKGIAYVRPSTQQEQHHMHSGVNSTANVSPQKFNINNHLQGGNQLTFTRVKQSLPGPNLQHQNAANNMLLQAQLIENEIQELSRQVKRGAVINTEQKQHYSNRQASRQKGFVAIQQPSNPQGQVNQQESQSMQRISFKELLESSRQQRVQGISHDNKNTTIIKNYNPKITQGHIPPPPPQPPTQSNNLVHMLKNSYQKYQQAVQLTNRKAHPMLNVGGVGLSQVPDSSMHQPGDNSESAIYNTGAQQQHYHQPLAIGKASQAHTASSAPGQSLQNTFRGGDQQYQQQQQQHNKVHLIGNESGQTQNNNNNIVVISKQDIHSTLRQVKQNLDQSKHEKHTTEHGALASNHQAYVKTKTAVTPQKRVRMINITKQQDIH